MKVDKRSRILPCPVLMKSKDFGMHSAGHILEWHNKLPFCIWSVCVK